MPIPPYLMLNALGGAPYQAHELLAGTTPAQLGSNFPAPVGGWVISSPNNQRNQFTGYIKNFKGERYCLTDDGSSFTQVRRENEGGAGNWGIVFTTTTAHTGGAGVTTVTGLHTVFDPASNDVVLAFANCEAGNTITICTSPTGASGSWTETSVGGLPQATPQINQVSVLFRNRIYAPDFVSGGAAKVWEIDPIAGTVTSTTGAFFPTGGNGYVDLCVFQDTLYAVASTFGSTIGLWQFGGGSWSLVGEIDNSVTLPITPTSALGKPCLWTDNTNMYLFSGRVTGPGLGSSAAWQGLPSGPFPWTLSETPIPPAYNSTTNRGLAVQDQWAIIVDNETDPANPDFYCIIIPGPFPGAGHEVLQWNGFGAVMGPTPGASVSVAFSIPEVKQGGGEAISQGAATVGEIEDEEAILGAYRLSYRTPGTVAGLTGRVYYSTGSGPPDTLATLVGGGTTFGPITGDNRVLLRTVDIDLALSGITPPDVSTWMIDLRP